MKQDFNSYESPRVEMIEIEVEQCFAQSSPLEDIKRNDPFGW